MRKLIPLIFILFFGCDKALDEKDVAIFTLKNRVDSLTVVSERFEFERDSIDAVYKKQTRFIKRTKSYCLSYANIVKKNPTQSVFLPTWIDRSFQWVHE